jgi:hypothetical protein
VLFATTLMVVYRSNLHLSQNHSSHKFSRGLVRSLCLSTTSISLLARSLWLPSSSHTQREKSRCSRSLFKLNCSMHCMCVVCASVSVPPPQPPRWPLHLRPALSRSRVFVRHWEWRTQYSVEFTEQSRNRRGGNSSPVPSETTGFQRHRAVLLDRHFQQSLSSPSGQQPVGDSLRSSQSKNTRTISRALWRTPLKFWDLQIGDSSRGFLFCVAL